MPMDPNRKRDLADRADLAGSVTAATIGAGLGAGKLRDAFREDHPAKFESGLKRLGSGLERAKLKPEKAAKVVHWASTAKPGFTPLVVGGAAAAAAAGAGNYSGHLKRTQAKEARRARDAAARAEEKDNVAKSAFGVVHPDLIEKAKKKSRGPGGMTPANNPAPAVKAKVKGAKKKAQAAAEAVADAVTPPKPVRMAARKASPSMPKASEMYDAVRGAIKPDGALIRHAPVLAAVGAGVGAGALLHHNHTRDDVAKSAFGVTHPEIAKATAEERGRAAARMTQKAGKLVRHVATEHGKYIAGAAGVGGGTAIAGVLADRARKAAPATIERKIAGKFPMPKAGPAIAIGAGGLGAAALLAHQRHKKETLVKSAFGVEHPQLDDRLLRHAHRASSSESVNAAV